MFVVNLGVIIFYYFSYTHINIFYKILVAVTSNFCIRFDLFPTNT
jgi:hypothetical protein